MRVTEAKDKATAAVLGSLGGGLQAQRGAVVGQNDARVEEY